MSIPSTHVATFRTLRADRYVDSCVVTRSDFTMPTFNETTGETEYPTSNPYSDECLVRPATGREVEFGEDIRQEMDYVLQLPYDAATLLELDEVAVTSALDPNIPTLTVLRGAQDSYLTHRRYACKAVTDA